MQNLVTVIVCTETRRCLICDPAFEVDRLLRLLSGRGLTLCGVLLTHSHPDHIDGVPEVLAAAGAELPVYIGAGEVDALRAHCQGARPEAELALVPLVGGELITCGRLKIQVLPTPGHTAAGRSFYVPQAGAVLTGDTLFVGSAGRTNFAGSDAQKLFRSLRLLASLPEETRIYPGHDYGKTRTSTLSWESEHNPYLRCPDAESFVRLQGRR